MNLIEYPDADMMMIDLANTLAGELNSALRSNDRVSFAVPGGTTPGPLFDDLCAADLPWDRVDVLLTDERWVPESSERSNTRLLRERLLTGRAAAATLIPLYADTETPEEAMPTLRQKIGPILPLNLLLLGMGTDMHTASLFPGADRLEEAFDTHAPVLLPMRADGADEPRVTLTAPVLKGAITTHVLITGAEKREVLERARNIHDPMEAPISAILGDATVHWAE
ncbi:6-phosphogluconolactonase [Aliiroseovarius sp. YM-037]|uniref:6-phosphogluconolactonase n=1 Tax=Aliiroseovarius sp. YM-037 TaxID=3341728 RepID=UPI003A810744